MARIRSVHPGLFTDEAFVSVSMTARVLLPGIWTEADDHGVFEWKPLTIKMKIFPADNVDVEALLGELVAADAVKRFSHDGKDYGAVRNFNKYQRPKKPAYRHPLPDELRTYVGSKDTSSEPVPHQFTTSTEKPPQREDGGGRMEGEKERKKDIWAVAKATRPKSNSKSEEFWKAYPRREGANPKTPALKKFDAAVKSGTDAESIIAAAKRYTAELQTQNQVGTKFVAQAVTWLNQQRWNDYPSGGNSPAAITDEQRAEMFAKLRATNATDLERKPNQGNDLRETSPGTREDQGNGGEGANTTPNDHDGNGGMGRMATVLHPIPRLRTFGDETGDYRSVTRNDSSGRVAGPVRREIPDDLSIPDFMQR